MVDAPTQIHLLGIRHHGPGSARSVIAALNELQPDALAVELPNDTQSVLSWIGAADLIPPVALLGVATDDPGRAVFLPFAEFSPEWQAIRWALRRGVPVRAIDLSLAVTLAGSADADADASGPTIDPIRTMAALAGDDDPERWWDDVVEHRGEGLPAFAAVAEAMTALRSGTASSAPEARREATMRQHLRALLTPDVWCQAPNVARVAVVCGAWHVPALAEPWPTAAADARLLRGQPKRKVSISWVPWTHHRLAAASGYRSGVASPGWYAHVFQHPGQAGVDRWFVDAARMLRSRGADTSPDHLIGASRAATALAALRGRPIVGLAEVVDAAEAVLAGQAGLDLIVDQLVIGDRVGSVPSDAPQVPLAADVAAEQRRWRLKPSVGRTTIEIDLRQPTAAGRSRLLHRLDALGVPWGRVVDGRGSSGTFRETWELRWDPETAVQIVEASAYGTTLYAAATARLGERASEAQSPADIIAVLNSALAGDLPDVIDQAVDVLDRLTAVHGDTVALIDSLPALARTLRYGDVRGTSQQSLRTTFDAMVVRVIVGVVEACRALDNDAAAAMVERLQAVQGALAVVDHPQRDDGWPRALAALAARNDIHGLIRGRATRLLHDGRQWAPDQVRGHLSRALSVGTEPQSGAAFVEGFVAGSGTVLVHDRTLLGVIDDWLCALHPDGFDSAVALLRRTFGAFDPAERRQLGLLVADVSRPDVVADDELDPNRVALVLDTLRSLVGQ